MAVSAVPYFRTLALLIGAQRMREMLGKLEYGNRDISGRLDRAWLPGGKLAISAREQGGSLVWRVAWVKTPDGHIPTPRGSRAKRRPPTRHVPSATNV